MKTIDLKRYGLTDWFEGEAAFYPGLFPARVTEQHHSLYRIVTGQGELQAGVTGKLLHAADGTEDFPAVGDWVMVDRLEGGAGDALIHHILGRKSAFVRKAAGGSGGVQIVAANIDVVFICMSLNADFNLRRLERYLAIAWDSRAIPVIVLTKADLCRDLPERLSEISSVGAGTDVIACSSMEENGYESVKAYIAGGRTIAFIGSSGVGKSTLINRLMGEDILATREIRESDARGRHATTHRQLLLLPGGGIVIDTPGMRELQVYKGNLARAFEDIEDLASRCRYADCSHTVEPGCAVRAAIDRGELAGKRFENYVKLQRETSYEGLNSRQLEEEKINRMFGGKGEMKRLMRAAKDRKGR